MGNFKRFLPHLIIVLALCIVSSVGIMGQNAIMTSNPNSINRPIIILDAGHGGLTNTIKV